jgi:hypothetical protein
VSDPVVPVDAGQALPPMVATETLSDTDIMHALMIFDAALPAWATLLDAGDDDAE